MKIQVAMNGNLFRGTWVVALILLLAAIPVLAQVPTGTIMGVVKDSSGAVVAGATVTILSPETGLTRPVTTGDDGAYRAPNLPTGHYDVKAERAGFRTETQQGLTLNVSDNAVINFTLQVGTSTQEVVVESEALQVNTSTSTLGGLVNEQQMSDLPLNGRNYMDLSLMQPGVTQDRNNGQYQGEHAVQLQRGACTVQQLHAGCLADFDANGPRPHFWGRQFDGSGWHKRVQGDHEQFRRRVRNDDGQPDGLGQQERDKPVARRRV